jgi:predicted RNA-binding protein (virulence factor B family)
LMQTNPIKSPFKIGETQTLEVDHLSKIGAFLVLPDHPDEGTVLLPKREGGDGCAPGDQLPVFVYLDSEDRPIATARQPKIEMGQIRPLKVVSVTKIGAFLDWGLEKDLLLPFHEQTVRVQTGREYLVALYLDKTGRPCATMKVYERLKADAPYAVGDWVRGYIYNINPNVGAFVAVDYQYHGLIPRQNMSRDIHVATQIKARVTEIRRRDHRLILSPHKQGYKMINTDGAVVMKKLKAAGGFLPYGDKTAPTVINQEFGLSKSAFKRAIGHLQKRGKLRIEKDGLHIILQ